MLKKTVTILGVAVLVSGALPLAGEYLTQTAVAAPPAGSAPRAPKQVITEKRTDGPFKRRKEADRQAAALRRDGWTCSVETDVQVDFGSLQPIPTTQWYVYSTREIGVFEDFYNDVKPKKRK